MPKLLLSIICLSLLVGLSSYGIWTRERPAGHYLADLRIELTLNEGTPGDRGNLLGIQPDLYAGDYRSPHRLHLKLAAYLEQARQLGLLGPRTVVVLPEHIGTWLWAVGEKQQLYEADDRQQAQQWLALSNPLRFAHAWFDAQGDDRLADTWLRIKAPRMVADYQRLFGGLAQEFGVTLVAGSIVLPQPRVEEGRLLIGQGALYNCSLVFGADGLALGQAQCELQPAAAARHYLQAAAPRLQVFETPAGPLGILVGNDANTPANYQQLHDQGAQLLAVAGNVGAALCADSSLRGVGVFINGKLWDQPGTGSSFISQPGQWRDSPPHRGARLINLWL